MDIGTELLHRATALVPVLRQRATTTEQLRRLPDETIDDLRRTELIKAARPTRFGGFALDLDQVMAIIAELGRGCGSSAWVYGVYCDHNITLGMFPGHAQEDVWARQPDALICAGLAPGGTLTRAAGGYRLTGRWSYSSGCTHADWAFVHSMLPSTDGLAPPESIDLFLPRVDFRIIDTWEVIGLCGTGSNDLEVNDAFVPAHRTLRVADANEGTGPGAAYNDAPLYRLPRAATVPYCLGAPVLGIAQAMYDDFVDNMRPRASRGFPLAEQQTIQMRVAEAAAEIDAARLLLQRDCKESMRAIRERGALTLAERARNRRDMGYCACKPRRECSL